MDDLEQRDQELEENESMINDLIPEEILKEVDPDYEPEDFVPARI